MSHQDGVCQADVRKHDGVCQADVINHIPTDESRNDGSIKMPAFPWATTKVAVWKGRHYVLCLMRSELSVIRLQPSGFLFSLYP